MVDFEARIQRAISELTGNEALLGMLETDAASEMLEWGISMAKSIVNDIDEADDLLADLSIVPRLKAVRRSMRSIGNWAAGKYVEPEDRLGLRDKLLEHFGEIFGEDKQLPIAEAMDDLINQVDDGSNTPHQLILKMIQLVANNDQGEN
ncbi:MAG TPA: hypothetical protein VLA72_08375 [Anaerolineales bacterium]|nr:hypothetical protein [Anaerolineales bacterium]